jgi:hypothetical protein
MFLVPELLLYQTEAQLVLNVEGTLKCLTASDYGAIGVYPCSSVAALGSPSANQQRMR